MWKGFYFFFSQPLKRKPSHRTNCPTECCGKKVESANCFKGQERFHPGFKALNKRKNGKPVMCFKRENISRWSLRPVLLWKQVQMQGKKNTDISGKTLWERGAEGGRLALRPTPRQWFVPRWRCSAKLCGRPSEAPCKRSDNKAGRLFLRWLCPHGEHWSLYRGFPPHALYLQGVIDIKPFSSTEAVVSGHAGGLDPAGVKQLWWDKSGNSIRPRSQGGRESGCKSEKRR